MKPFDLCFVIVTEDKVDKEEEEWKFLQKWRRWLFVILCYTKRFLSTEFSYNNTPRGVIEVERIRSSANRFDVPWGVAQGISNIYYYSSFIFSGLAINRNTFY